MALRLSTTPGSGQKKNGPGSLSDMPTAADKHLGRGYVDLFLLLRKERGLITHGALEGRGRSGKGVSGVLHPHKFLAPVGGLAETRH
jgi:hypothetical protein